MTTRQTIVEFFKGYKKPFVGWGFTGITLKRSKLIIHHNGNMGHSIKNVNDSLRSIKFPYSIEELKSKSIVQSETGSPDYSYCIIFDLGVDLRKKSTTV